MGISINGQRHLQQFLPVNRGLSHASGRGNGHGHGFKDVEVTKQVKDNTPVERSPGQNWCGPAIGATLSRMLGTSADGEHAMAALADKYTAAKGTTPDNMVKMINDVGGHVDGQMMTGRFESKELDAQLAKGNKVIAQVGLKDGRGGATAHWVMVSGKDEKGNYQIKDPLRGELTVKPNQLRDALYRAPGLGGLMIPVAPGTAPRSQSPMGPMSPLQEIMMRRDSFEQMPVVSANGEQYSLVPSRNGVALDSGEGGLVNPMVDPSAVPAAPAKAIANDVVQQLKSTDEDVREQGRENLEQLEKSSSFSSFAKKAFDFVLRVFGKQPGGGQRPGYNGYGW